MELLPIEFTGTGEVAGIVFKQLFRYKDLCLYSRSDNSYEVIKARPSKGGTFNLGGVMVDFVAKERYPTKGGWGAYEHYTKSLDKAIRLFNEQAATMKDYHVELKRDVLTI